jgi:hypothetical protein
MMVLFIRYTKSLGDSAIYTRLRNATGQFWDFVAAAWVNSLVADCKVFLLESVFPDDVSQDALYSATASIPNGGPWVEETVLVSSGKVIGYDNTEGVTDSETLNLKQSLLAYVGDADNVFSIVAGSFTGLINFYACSLADFSANMADPANATLVCTLGPTGVMTNVADIATSGEVLFFRLETFNCLADLTVNIYAAAIYGNVRVYVPLGAQTIATAYVYYPTADASLLVYEGSNLITFSESAYGKSLALIPTINWDMISQPVNLTTTQVIV